jgi:hypothetical protein
MKSPERVITLSTGRSVNQFLNEVFSEGIKSHLHRKALTEKEKQDSLVSTSQEDSNSPEGSEEDQGSSKTMDDEQEKLAQGDIKPKDIVDKLNSIRSGRSFKDSAVASAMEEYIGSLSKAEKVALLAFLKGIAQIVTGEINGQQAEDPGKHPADIQMDKSNEPHTVHKKPNVIKSSPAGNSGKKPSAEDTSAPSPIIPKKR